MKPWTSIPEVGIMLVLVLGLTGCGRSEGDVRRLVEDVQVAALEGMNQRDANALDGYFATVEEGAQENGLAETLGAYKNFIGQLSAESVQIHTFDIQALEMHEEGGLARVTYGMHISVLRGGAAIYTVRFTQNLAVLRTPGGWRISGGDTPQIEETTGVWPPP